MEPITVFILLGSLISVAIIAGFSSGLFGIGGGAIMVPALHYTFKALGIADEVTMHCAVATSAAVIIVNSTRSVRRHHARGAVDMDILIPKQLWRSYALWIGVGSFIAAWFIAPKLSAESLTLIFAIVAMLVALQFILGRPDFILRKTVPGGIAPPLVGSGVGGLSALMGIGGGSLSVPLLSLCNVPIHRAIGTASGFGLAIAVPATIGFIISGLGVSGRPLFSLGYVNGVGFLIIAIVSALMVPVGVKAAHAMDAKKLKRIFGFCLLAVALNMARETLFL
ncbi:putative membrane protein YfcA [Litorimonas taeanensis]|uniref:Probable membrane transporter protein n=1 Tax=Litorimonas taeanensis TaxID=568099 RepID=A0A420WJL5_9PROT|nr:sulfite exporter TauE/SafE family protein [Litorimonas taeanensis]RKQ71214.1 putative membrane protein YfcA [Litorimonas taeanensis]